MGVTKKRYMTQCLRRPPHERRSQSWRTCIKAAERLSSRTSAYEARVFVLLRPFDAIVGMALVVTIGAASMREPEKLLDNRLLGATLALLLGERKG